MKFQRLGRGRFIIIFCGRYTVLSVPGLLCSFVLIPARLSKKGERPFLWPLRFMPSLWLLRQTLFDAKKVLPCISVVGPGHYPGDGTTPTWGGEPFGDAP